MFKIFYGNEPKLSNADRPMFSRGKYECKELLKNRKGAPVAISQCTEPGYPVWKVEHSFTCVVFANYEDAMAYCKGRFYRLDGKAV